MLPALEPAAFTRSRWGLVSVDGIDVYKRQGIQTEVLYRRPKARIAHAVKFVCKCQWYLRAHFVAGLLLALFIYR